MRNVCENVSSRPTDLLCGFCWNDSACLTPVRLWLPSSSCYHYPTVFSESVFPHFWNCLENLPTTNNLCIFWHSKFQQVSIYSFCSWDDKFTNLYFTWSNHLLTSLRLEMIVWVFSEHQNKTIDTDRYKESCFTARISQVNVNTMKRNFEQRSELQVAKCLIVHVLSSTYNVSRIELRNRRKATQQWSFRVSHDIVLNQVRVYHERLCADDVLSKFWFLRSSSSQHYSKFLTNNTSENVSQIRTEECKTRCFICKLNLVFLRSSRHLNCDTVFAVIASFLNQSVHGFNNIPNGRVKIRSQIVEFWQLWKFLVKKHKFFLREILVHWSIGYFWNCNLPLTFQIQLLWWKVCWRAQCIVWNYLSKSIWNQLCCKRFHC